MTVLLDPATDGADLRVARILEQCVPVRVARDETGRRYSDNRRAVEASLADLTVVLQHRRTRPLVRTFKGNRDSRRFSRLVARELGTGVMGWTRDRIFGRSRKHPHDRAVVVVQPQEGTPAWAAAAAILCALGRYCAK